jgi:hypothetical protein
MTVEDSYEGVYTRTITDGLFLKFDDEIQYNTDFLITLNTTAQNVITPKQAKIAIYGCGTPIDDMGTLAQVEKSLNQ